MSINLVTHDLIDVIVTAAQHLAWRADSKGVITLRWWETSHAGAIISSEHRNVNAYDDDAMSAEGDELLRTVYDSIRARYKDCEGKTDGEIAAHFGCDEEPYAYWLGKVPGTAMNLHPRALGVARMALRWYEYNACEKPDYRTSRARSFVQWMEQRLLDELVHPLDRGALSGYDWHTAMSGGGVDKTVLINEIAVLSSRLRMLAQPIVD